MALPDKPITRQEMYLSNMAGQGTPLPETPITREEMYLDYIAKNGGGGGTGDGDMKKAVYDSDLSVANAGGIKSFVDSSISDKVDKEVGKGLSTNDFTDAFEEKLDDLPNIKSIGSGLTLNTTTGELTATGISITIDTEIDDTSTNPVQNKVIAEALDDKADSSDIPTKVSDLTNDSGFITNAVNNLVNYYTKSQTYTQSEVDSLITAAKNGRFIAVATLPTTDIDTKAIYLVPSSDPQAQNVKDEYINLDGTSSGWELIGSTEIDLSGYVQKSQTAGLLKNDGTVDTTTTGAVSANTSAITAIKDGTDIDSFGDVETALGDKVDKVAGKGLSTNDYTNTDKAIVGGVNDKFAGTVSLLDDTTGWLGGNKAKVTATGTTTRNGVTYTVNADKSISANGATTINSGSSFGLNEGSGNRYNFTAGEKIIISGGVSNKIRLNLYLIEQSSTEVLVGDTPVEWTVPTTGAYAFQVYVNTNTTVDNVTLYPMILTPEEYAISPAYRPHHESVDEVKADKSDVNDKFTASVTLLDNTVGWSGKNRLKNTVETQTKGGVLYTVNADKTISLSNTATETSDVTINTMTGAELKAIGSKLILDGGYSNKVYLHLRTADWSTIAKAESEAVVFNTSSLTDGTTYYISAVVWNDAGDTSGIVLKPMITTPEEYAISPTYRPYHKSVEEYAFPRSEQAALGAKNLYDCIASTTTDEYGLTWTVAAADKNIITVSGTPTGFKAFPTYSNNVLPAGRYILSGIREDTTNVALNYLGLRNGTTIVQELSKTLVGNEYYFDIPDNVVYDNIYITLKRNNNNVACSGTIKLMIRLASDTDPAYAPYAKTNKQLTDVKADKTELDGWSSQSQVSSGSITFTGIDDTNNNGYELFINVTASSTQKNPSSQIESISGTGTSSMSITFSTNADEGAYGKLRIIK